MAKCSKQNRQGKRSLETGFTSCAIRLNLQASEGLACVLKLFLDVSPRRLTPTVTLILPRVQRRGLGSDSIWRRAGFGARPVFGRRPAGDSGPPPARVQMKDRDQSRPPPRSDAPEIRSLAGFRVCLSISG
ncbi:hypothetical protein SKAU_G00382330 [Synaphobranchus kaupii]|uniref:Uncharacterized protein n=1 Tax=Synaphobranchus kaupii TaxID=118154 RepID=A0A9Q1EDX8_SYNKA|nr:hypothetical protein SKAU_G00382330 [Synaphobranchus kaupii]